MANPEAFANLPPIDASQIVEKFQIEAPAYSIPVDIVDGVTKERRFVVYDVSTATYDVLVAAGYDPADNISLAQQLTKAAERQIPDLDKTLKQRQEYVDKLNDHLKPSQA